MTAVIPTQHEHSARAGRLATIVIAASAIMAVSSGLRQCFGLFQESVTGDLAVSVTSFSFALALNNLVWGVTQPFVGALGDRFGPRPVLIGCGLLYAAGLALMATSDNAFIGLDIGVGVLAGIGVAGTGFGVLLGAVSRAAAPSRRSQLLGLVSGIGSLGILGLAPLGQQLIQLRDWRVAALAYAGLCVTTVAMSLFIAGRTDTGQSLGDTARPDRTMTATREALSHRGFVCMSIAFFACGFQLQFIVAHLPRFLGLCGLAPSVGAAALGIIGVCNAAGSYAFGLLGARYSRKRLLAAIYAVRTLAIVAYMAFPISELSTLVFAAVMGFTWLGVIPLVSGLIGQLFGLRNFNLLFGVVFFLHQIGGFIGPWLGGFILDRTGGYALAWYAMIAIGTTAALLQWPMDDAPRARAQGLAAA